MHTRLSTLFVGVGLMLAAVSPIIIRHDLSDAEYATLAEPYEDVIVHMNLEEPGAPPDGEGTLVRQRWVLTAAHVAVEVERGHSVIVADDKVEVAEIHLHPAWDGGATDDIALIELRNPVRDVDPVPLYDERDEVGRLVTVVGRGDTGTGLTGPIRSDGKLRGARNRVDGGSEGLIWWRFDAPDDTNSVHLEGISGPGDSGGPAFLDIDGSPVLAGVSSSQSTSATGGKEGFYGVTEYYVRVSDHIDWIDDTISLSE